MSPSEAIELQETIDYYYILIYGPLVVGTIIYLIWQRQKKKKNEKDLNDFED